MVNNHTAQTITSDLHLLKTQKQTTRWCWKLYLMYSIFFVWNLSSSNLILEIIFKPILQTCILGVIIGTNGKNIDDIMSKSLTKIIKVDQVDVSVGTLLTY